MGLLGLVVRPERAGSAYHTLATATAMLLILPVVGNPDNHGGQAGLLDPMFAVMALPLVAAALAARPWRTWQTNGLKRPQFLVLAGVSLPAIWYGVGQALMQRNTWPPLADPHHQAHWYAMALLACMVVLVLATASLSGESWRPAAIAAATAAISVGGASLLAPAAASRPLRCGPAALSCGASRWSPSPGTRRHRATDPARTFPK